ncbi:MAG: MFS transporter [Lachnospiraceae bacterium]|nr:MFS transporter [Lachnospiraceae bacterium]
MYKELPRPIWIMLFASAVNNLGNFVFTYFTLIITDYNGENSIQSGVIFFWAMFLYIPAANIGGKIADIFDKKVIYCIFKICSICCLFTTVFVSRGIIKIVFIIMSFFFTGMTKPVFDGWLTDLTSVEKRKEVYSILYMGDNWANIVAPLLVTGFLNNSNELILWDAVSSIAAVFMLLFLKKPVVESINLEYLDTKVNESGYGLTRKKVILLGIFSIFFFVYSQNQFTLPLYLKKVFIGDAIKCYSYIMSINAGVVLFATPVITKVTKKISNINLLFISGVLFSLGFGLYGIMINVAWFFFLTIVWSIGEILFSLSLYAYINENVTEKTSGKANSLIVIMKSIGMCMGSSLMGIIISQYNWKVIWCGILFISCVASITLLFYKKFIR